jgi:NAD(P)-dependent dehydrogenase (short-subunit alcohol dehydrogenase family)
MGHTKWTTENMPDLSGKVMIVTGSNSGLGYESVRAFAEKGAEVILACRSAKKGAAAKDKMGNTKGKIVVMQLDLQDLASVKQFAADFSVNYHRLDVLLNNAGIMTTPYFLTKDGLEGQIGVNHFGHFALTGQLLGRIAETPKSRVVNVSSMAHVTGKMDFDNLLFENGKEYTPMKSYGQSKLANLLFTYELQRYFETKGIDSISVAAHPGVSHTNLTQHIENKLVFKLFSPLLKLLAQPPDRGALPQIRASVDSSVKGAEYYGPMGFKEIRGHPVLVKSTRASRSTEDAKKLWEVSEKLTGTTFKASHNINS